MPKSTPAWSSVRALLTAGLGLLVWLLALYGGR